jgi:hypothetical protein
MIVLPDGTILIVKGEGLPARCEACGNLFPVPRDLEPEVEAYCCPYCAHENDLSQQGWRLVAPPAEEQVV